jgi:hypothetical protein
MKDEQVRRYARHVSLPEVGGLGQTALLVASARLVLREIEPLAEMIAGCYLAASGVGTVIVTHADDAQRAELAAHGLDTRVAATGEGRDVALAPKPTWWPAAEGDGVALALFRGALAATRWLAETIERG